MHVIGIRAYQFHSSFLSALHVTAKASTTTSFIHKGKLPLPQVTICTQNGYDNTEFLYLGELVSRELVKQIEITLETRPDLLKAALVGYSTARMYVG